MKICKELEGYAKILHHLASRAFKCGLEYVMSKVTGDHSLTEMMYFKSKVSISEVKFPLVKFLQIKFFQSFH